VKPVRRVAVILVTLLLVSGLHWVAGRSAIVVGAVYPTGGRQGPGGVEEYLGLRLAADYVNARGGVNGRPVEVRLEPADSREAAPRAVRRLAESGISIIVGSYGSTISRPAAETAARLGLLFWETGAVGQLSMPAAQDPRVFRFAPTGASLGRASVAFIRDQIGPRAGTARSLRYAVAYVDDVYGRAVGLGAVAEIRASHLPLVAALPYALPGVDYTHLARQVSLAQPDILVVAAYLEDGIALRRAMLRERVPLIATIGTSSSHCMPEYGRALGADAVGVFASDKPDGDVVRMDRLSPQAASALRWAQAEYRRRHGGGMSSPALSGFAGGVALMGHVLPAARDVTPAAVADGARRVRLPAGSLPNASGLAFGSSGSPEQGANLRATTVIWEWIRPNTRAVVWPAAFATHPIVFR
jgi:branched-chain amino acid transport system substrate-binding protein